MSAPKPGDLMIWGHACFGKVKVLRPFWPLRVPTKITIDDPVVVEWPEESVCEMPNGTIHILANNDLR